MKKQIEKLQTIIKRSKELYYHGLINDPDYITDQEYDQLEKELKSLDPNNEILDYVGYDISQSTFNKIKHVDKMTSLGKAYTEEDMLRWRKDFNDNLNIIESLKMDGFAIELVYECGEGSEFQVEYILKEASTRGDGFIGEDITENVKMISDIPHRIIINNDDLKKVNSTIRIRGEIFMKTSIFNELLKENIIDGESRIRNIAPGSVRQKDPLVTKRRKLNFFAYDIKGCEFDTYSQKMEFLNKMKIPTVPMNKISFDDMTTMYNSIIIKKELMDYPIDGVVFRLDNEDEFQSAGETSHHPKGSIAWKFEAETGVSVLRKVEWQVTRTGLINPVGKYDPVEVDGAILSAATLHNISQMMRLDIGIGDEIEVARQGGVIPKIFRVVSKSSADSTVIIPSECPICHKPTEIETSDDGIKTLHCTNHFCPAIMKDRLNHFCKVMGIKGVSDAIISKLYDEKLVTTFANFYELKIEDILKLDGFKQRSSEKIINAIQGQREVSFNVFLRSLGIHTLGKTSSKLIADRCNSIEALDELELSEIEGIGEIGENSIREGLLENEELITHLLQYVTISMVDETISEGKLQNLNFCITGKLSDKKMIQSLIESAGGNILSSVSSKLDYLIYGDKAGSKLDKAKKNNVPIITEDEFMLMLK